MVDRYYYFIVSPKRVILLGSSNNLDEAESKAIEKLETKIDQFIGKKFIFCKNNKYL